MRRNPISVREPVAKLSRCCLVLLISASLAVPGVGQEAAADRSSAATQEREVRAIGREPGPGPEVERPEFELLELQVMKRQVWRLLRSGLDWYRRTPPGDRMIWGGLVACAGLGLAVLCERTIRLRRRKIVPPDFTSRFLDRLHEGKLDGGKALDYCEMNPSPAARVALAAVRRWGRPAVDLERAVALAHRVEAERLRRNVGTLRRIAALAPLLGLLGTLMATGRVLATIPGAGPVAAGAAVVSSSAAWGPALAAGLSPLTLGVAIATLALVAYDALLIRIERLTGALDRLGAETIDAIAMATLPAAPSLLASPVHSRTRESHPEHARGTPGPARTPHQSPSHRRRVDDAGHRSAPGEHDIGF